MESTDKKPEEEEKKGEAPELETKQKTWFAQAMELVKNPGLPSI